MSLIIQKWFDEDLDAPAGAGLQTKALTAALSFVGARASAISKGMTAALSFVGNLVKRTSKGLVVAALSFSGAFIKQTSKLMTAALSFIGAFTKQRSKVLAAATLSFVGTQTHAVSKGMTATLSFVGVAARRVSKFMSAALSFIGNLVGGHLFAKALTGALSFSASSSPAITDSLQHNPTSDYSSDIRPALGGTYVDAVFGATVRRISDIGANVGADQNYSFHWSNCDGTLCFHVVSAAGNRLDVKNCLTGQTYKTGLPGVLTEVRWSFVDPDVYYYYETTKLKMYRLSTNTASDLHDFGSTMQDQGGSVNTHSADDNIFVVCYGGTHKIWKRDTNEIYTGNIPLFSAGGFTGILADASYVYQSGATSWLGAPLVGLYSYAIDHGTKTVNVTPIKAWGLNGGDHCSAMVCSDGHPYFVCSAADNTAFLCVVRLDIDRDGMSEANQLLDVKFKIAKVFGHFPIHFSPISLGVNKDWIFFSNEDGADVFGYDPATAWGPFWQEIWSLNIADQRIRRYTHHRSRSDGSIYQYEPRVSTSADGSRVLWVSNQGVSSPANYADLYTIDNPLGGGGNTLTRLISHLQTAALSFVGVVTRRTQKSASAAVNFIGAQTRTTAKHMTAVANFVGTAAKQIAKRVAAAANFAGTLTTGNLLVKALTATLNFVGTVVGGRAFVKALAAALSFIGAVKKLPNKALSALLSFDGAISSGKRLFGRVWITVRRAARWSIRQR